MAITTLAGVRAGLKPPFYFQRTGTNNLASDHFGSMWRTAGSFGPGALDVVGLNGAALTAPVTGQLPFEDPVSGSAYLARLQYNYGTSGQGALNRSLLLCDRLWHNSGIDVTSASPQSITTPTWPARDDDASTNGKGVYISLEVTTTMGASTPSSISISYTNSAGTSGRTGDNMRGLVASAPVGQTWVFDLENGADLGVRSVESFTLGSTWTSGSVALVAFRVLAVCTPGGLGNTRVIDAITGAMPKIHNGSVLFFMEYAAAQASGFMAGRVEFAHG